MIAYDRRLLSTTFALTMLTGILLDVGEPAGSPRPVRARGHEQQCRLVMELILARKGTARADATDPAVSPHATCRGDPSCSGSFLPAWSPMNAL